MAIDLNALRERVNWLVQQGAPVPVPDTLHGGLPVSGAVWDWDVLRFTRGDKTFEASVEILMNDMDPTFSGASRTLTALQGQGLAPGDPNVRVQFANVPPPPSHPFPVDSVVGLERPDEPGAYDGADYFDWVAYKNRGTIHTAADGRKFHPEMRGVGFGARYVWVLER